MKKLFVLLSIILLCLTTVTFSQNLTFKRLGPDILVIPYTPPDTQYVGIQALSRNNTSGSINVRFARITVSLPAGWITSMCYDMCYPADADTIPPPSSAPPFTLPANHSDSMFVIDFTCVSEGTATIIVRLYNNSNPAVYSQDTFKVQLVSVGINNINSYATDYSLLQNYPNPFNPYTKITFSVPTREKVSLRVYDVFGREVAVLVNDEMLSSGTYDYDFNAGEFGLSSGVYFYTLKTESFRSTKKMIMLK